LWSGVICKPKFLEKEMTMAWAVLQPDSYKVFLSYDEAVNLREECAGGEIVPLIRITDDEIAAIEWSQKEAEARSKMWTVGDSLGFDGGMKAAGCSDSLRNLLKRIKSSHE
jgi:hypothetical protein